MQTYFYIILIVILFFLIESIIKSKDRIFEKLGISILVLISGLRFETGTDYIAYRNIFDKLSQKLEFRDYFLLEKGYIYLNEIVILIGLNFNFLIGFISFIYIVLVYKTIKKYEKKYLCLGMFIFLSSFNLYFFSLSIIRQSLAIGLSFYAIKYVIEKKKIMYFLYILIGFFFHKGILVMLPIYFIEKLNRRIISIISFLLVILFLFRYKVVYGLQLLVERLDLSKYQGYFVGVNLEIGKIGLIYIIFYILILFLIRKEKNIKSKIIYNYIYIYIVLRLLMSLGFHSLFYRVIPFFEIYFVLFIPEVYRKVTKKSKGVFIFFIIIFQILLFVYEYNNWLKVSDLHYRLNRVFKIKI